VYTPHPLAHPLAHRPRWHDNGDCSYYYIIQGAINETSSSAAVGVRGGLISYARAAGWWRSAQTLMDSDARTHTPTHGTHAHASACARRDFIYRPVNTFSKLDIRDNNVNTEWCLLSHYYGRRRRSGIIIYRVRVNLSLSSLSLYIIIIIISILSPLRHFTLARHRRRHRPTASSCGLLYMYIGIVQHVHAKYIHIFILCI